MVNSYEIISVYTACHAYVMLMWAERRKWISGIILYSESCILNVTLSVSSHWPNGFYTFREI